MTKYLTIGTLIAIVLNPIFGLVDYMAMNEFWIHFMVIRISVTLLIAGVIFYKPLIQDRPLHAGFIVLTSIVTQDAYFFSHVTEASINQAALAYMADFVGASMVLLWPPALAILFLGVLVLVNIGFYNAYSEIPVDYFMSEGGLLVFAGSIFSMAMIVFRYHSVKSNLISKLELLKSNRWMAVQNEIIEEKSAELQRSNNRLKEFAYIVSHDLKTPLRGIKNLAAWIREDCGAVLSREGISHLELIDKQIIKMEQLIVAVLEYSKTGNTKSKTEWINLDDIIREVVETVEIDGSTRFNINTKVPAIKGTRIVISQVLQNLLSNSVKHNDKSDKWVNIEVKEDGDSVLFSIEDNGPGIDPAYHGKIFDLFQTLRSDEGYESTGIGLPVARKMVEESGGSMWVESKPGSGSVFYFSLPKVI